ncbi:hypothetical protein ACFLR3_00950 [Campylobacterota bacterium]
MKKQVFKQRIVWGFNPVTRKVPSKKRYNRTRLKGELNRERKTNG